MMIKSVLSVVPNYYIAILHAPKSIISELEKIIRQFLWKGNIDQKKKIPLISLQTICKDKFIGDAGLQNLST